MHGLSMNIKKKNVRDPQSLSLVFIVSTQRLIPILGAAAVGHRVDIEIGPGTRKNIRSNIVSVLFGELAAKSTSVIMIGGEVIEDTNFA